MSNNLIVETERLKVSRLTLEDAPFILQLLNTPGWLTFIGDRNVHNLSDAERYLLNGPLKSYADNGFGLWKVTLKELDVPIGMCGFLKRDTLIHPDIGFAFLPEHEGKGFAKESAVACLAHFKSTYPFSEVDAITIPKNTRSQKLLQSLGFNFVRVLDEPNLKEQLNLYSRSDLPNRG